MNSKHFIDLFSISVNHGYLIQILIAELLFIGAMNKKEPFFIKFIVGVFVYASLSVIIPNLIATYTEGLFSISIFFLSLLLWKFTCENKFSEILFYCISAQFIQNLAFNIESIVRIKFHIGHDLVQWFLVTVIIMVIVYASCYFLLIKKMKGINNANLNNLVVFIFAITNVILIYIVQYYFQIYKIDVIWVTRVPLIYSCIFGLCFQYDIISLGNKSAENILLERIIKLEKREYETTQSTMNLINLKAHDLKHQIERYRLTGKSDEDELNELDEIVKAFELSIKTGNPALDTLLSQKKLVCSEYGIDLVLVIQGESLDFMSSADIYSVFGNAIDNAIEYELKIEEKRKRSIVVNVFQKQSLVFIRIENYCETAPKMIQGVYVSSKNNAEYHGFGIKSIEHIIRKYGGNVTTKFEDRTFKLNIMIPHNLPQK